MNIKIHREIFKTQLTHISKQMHILMQNHIIIVKNIRIRIHN